MFRYLLGVLLAQVIAAGLLWLNLGNLNSLVGWVSIIVPTIAVALVTTFWFGALSRQAGEARISQLREEFARERQRLQLNAERVKAKILKKTHAQITRETKRTHAKANFKVGATISAAVGFGVLLMFTQFITAGLILVTSAGGVLGGYMLRLKRERQAAQNVSTQFQSDFTVDPTLTTQVDTQIGNSAEQIDVEEVTATHQALPPQDSPKRARIIEAVPSRKKRATH